MKQSEVALSAEHLQGAYSFLPGKSQLILSLLLFAIIPAVFLTGALQLTKVSGPQWLGTNFENSYTYLFNSLRIVKGEPPFHIDHPGTTTQVFGAAVLRACAHGSKGEIVREVLRDPEKFLSRMHGSLLIVCVLAIWIFPWLTALTIGNYATGLLLQFPILFFNTVWHYSIWFGSDLALIAFSIAAVSLCLVLLNEREGGSQKLPTLVLAGVMCGLGIVTKLTFFPLILITLLCCQSLRGFLVFGTSFLGAAAIAILPIYSELPRVFQWIFRLSIYSGRYGSAGIGFATAQYLTDVTAVLSAEPSIWLIPTLATGAIVCLILRPGWKSRSSSGPGPISNACIVFLVQTVSFAILSREGGFHFFHYFIPLFLSTGLNLVFLWQLVHCRRYVRRPRAVASTLLLCLLLFGASNLIFRLPALYSSLRSMRLSELAIYSQAKKKTENAVRVDYYRSISPEFAMWFASDYSGRAFADILERQFPKALFYQVFVGNFETFESSIRPEDVFKEHDHLLFFGNRARPGWVDRGRLDCFNANKLKVIKRTESQDELRIPLGYVLEEWTRE
jgi:hypothetical protein